MNIKNCLQIDDFVEFVDNAIKRRDKSINPNKLVYCDSCHKCCRYKNLEKHINTTNHLGRIGYEVRCYAPFKCYGF